MNWISAHYFFIFLAICKWKPQIHHPLCKLRARISSQIWQSSRNVSIFWCSLIFLIKSIVDLYMGIFFQKIFSHLNTWVSLLSRCKMPWLVLACVTRAPEQATCFYHRQVNSLRVSVINFSRYSFIHRLYVWKSNSLKYWPVFMSKMKNVSETRLFLFQHRINWIIHIFTAVLMSELTKLLTCLILVYSNGKSFGQFMNTLKSTIIDQPFDTLKVCVPSFLYIIQNNLLYVSASNLDAATYQVSLNFKKCQYCRKIVSQKLRLFSSFSNRVFSKLILKYDAREQCIELEKNVSKYCKVSKFGWKFSRLQIFCWCCKSKPCKFDCSVRM